MKREFGIENRNNLNNYLDTTVFYDFKRAILYAIEGMKARAEKGRPEVEIYENFYRDIYKTRITLASENREFAKTGLVPVMENTIREN